MPRLYDITQLGAAVRAATKTVLTVTAAAAKPVEVLASHIEATDNATSFQMTAQWQKITTLGAGTTQGTTKITKVDVGDAAASFTVIGDISTEPTTYDVDVIREKHAGPSVIGYHSHQGPEPAQVRIEPGETWGLVVTTASYANTIWAASALVRETS